MSMESNISREERGSRTLRYRRAQLWQGLTAGAMMAGIIAMFPLSAGTHISEEALFIIQGVLAVVAFCVRPPRSVRTDKRRYGLDILFNILYIVLACYFLLVGLLYIMFHDLGSGWYGTTERSPVPEGVDVADLPVRILSVVSGQSQVIAGSSGSER